LVPPAIFTYCTIELFFFQAEDGIRDRNVTGVQTCALPISFSTIIKRYSVKKEYNSASSNTACMVSTFKSICITSNSSSADNAAEIGRASCRERVYISDTAGPY